MILSSSLKTLKITLFTAPGCLLIQSFTVSTAISAALRFGKLKTPVEMQQKTMVLSPFSSAISRQDL